MIRRTKYLAFLGLFKFFLIGIPVSCHAVKKTNHILVGNQYAKDGLLREAISSYQKSLRKKKNNMTAHRNLGMVLVKAGNFKKAAYHLEIAMKQYRENFDANYYLAEAYRALDKYADAIYHYQKALRIKPKDAKALKSLSWSYFKIRYYSESLFTAKKLAKITPKDPQAAIIMSRTLLKLKRFKESLAVIRTAKYEATKESLPYFLSVEGDVIYELGKVKKAANLYHEAIKGQPLLAGALLGLGKCYLKKNKKKSAITYIERAIRIRPKLLEGHYLLGKAYEKTNISKSLKHYQYFRKQASTDPEFLSMLTSVSKKIHHLKHNLKSARSTRRRTLTR